MAVICVQIFANTILSDAVILQRLVSSLWCEWNPLAFQSNAKSLFSISWIFRIDSFFDSTINSLRFFSCFFLNWSNRYFSQLKVWMNKWIECVEGTISKTKHRSLRLTCKNVCEYLKFITKLNAKKGNKRRSNESSRYVEQKICDKFGHWMQICVFLLSDVSAPKIQNLKIDTIEIYSIANLIKSHDNALKIKICQRLYSD